MWTRRTMLGGLLATGISPVAANVAISPRPQWRPGPKQPLDIPAATRALIDETGLTGKVCCLVVETETGKVVAEVEKDVALPPASVAKALTAAYAFDVLGPGHRFETRVYGTGPIRDGRLDGDLILAGDGNPGLDSAQLSSLVGQLANTGLRSIAGRFLIWDGALPHIDEIEPGQPDHLGYNPSVSGLNLNYNRVHLQWRVGANGPGLTVDARAGDVVPQVNSVQARLDARSSPIFEHSVDADSGAEVWSVARPALRGNGARWLPVRESGIYSGDVFATLAKSREIDLPAPERAEIKPAGAVLASHVSAPLATIGRGMLRHSTNLTAEIFGLRASAERFGRLPETLAESATEMDTWAMSALGMTSPGLVDHSGLSGASRISPSDMVTGLRTLGPKSALGQALREIGLNTEAGRPEPLTLQAKTGTLNFVSGLAGFVTPDDGPSLTFAIFTADLDRRAAIAPGDEENPAGTRTWTRRSRHMQYQLVRLWANGTI